MHENLIAKSYPFLRPLVQEIGFFPILASGLFGLSIFLACYWLSNNKSDTQMSENCIKLGIGFAVADLIISLIGFGFLTLIELIAVVFLAHTLLKFSIGRAFGVLGISLGLSAVGMIILFGIFA